MEVEVLQWRNLDWRFSGGGSRCAKCSSMCLGEYCNYFGCVVLEYAVIYLSGIRPMRSMMCFWVDAVEHSLVYTVVYAALRVWAMDWEVGFDIIHRVCGWLC